MKVHLISCLVSSTNRFNNFVDVIYQKKFILFIIYANTLILRTATLNEARQVTFLVPDANTEVILVLACFLIATLILKMHNI